MKRFVCEPISEPLRGATRVPGDKSISHRSLIFAALGSGTSTVEGLSGGEDNHRTRHAMAALGAGFEEGRPGMWRVTGVGVDGLKAPEDTIDCGNSGTSIRLLCGLLAGQSFESKLSGDESLSKRPMNRVAKPLGQMGATVTGESGAIEGEIYPTLTVSGGNLSGIDYDSPIASAQVKSSILLAGLYADGSTRVREPSRSRDHTERMLAGLGVPIEVEGRAISLDPASWDRRFPAQRYAVPGDPSSAAFALIGALIAGGAPVILEDVCGNPTRTGFIDVLAAMGANFEIEHAGDLSGEPVCRIVIDKTEAELSGALIAGDLTVRAIDEIPILSVAAALATGETTIADAAELRVKESDRIKSTVAMLRALGAEVDESESGMTIAGSAGSPFSGGEVDADGDHRIAMSAAIASLAAKDVVVVNDVANVATSFPTFVDTMNGLGARIRVE